MGMIITTLAFSALALCLAIITFLSLGPSQRSTVLRRLRLEKNNVRSDHRYTATVAHDEKRQQQQPKSSKSLASTVSDLAATFPPSQRGQLSTLGDKELSDSTSPFTQDKERLRLLGLEEDYADPKNGDTYVYSGFSVREITALGDFPDYATLSQVPMPKPYRDFVVEKAKPRPYRPFRWPYHQTMSLTKLEPDWWLELESTYISRIAQRKSLYETHGSAVLQYLPGSELACKELLEMCLQFLCARYPQYFSISPDNTWFENRILGGRYNVREKHPLLVILDHIPEDFALVLRDPETGLYVFRAGLICSALGWNVETKIGLPLHEIHGPVPDYKEKMMHSMDRYFSKLPTSKPIQRGSWGLEASELMYMPPGSLHETLRESQDPALKLSDVYLRVDWQTLRRLPLSGAVAFNFKALFTPLEGLRDEPCIPGLLLRVLRDGPEGIMVYKNAWHTLHIALPALEEWDREQRANGIIEADWEPVTLDESPWFPRWEEKWHAEQGF